LSHIIKQLLVYFFILVATGSLHSQEKATIPDIEKTYLHTDRSTYEVGESIWYKVYLVYAYNNLLFNHSNILYVELISPDSKIIAQNKTQLEDGLGHGDFKLTDSLGVKAGVYQIRAYTNYSRNYGKEFVFKKEINIIDVYDNRTRETASNLNPQKTELKNAEIPKKRFDVQFFPEGGSLINSIESVVAFKAVDTNGLPIKVQGEVFDSNGELITLFGSLHDGMGKFKLKPHKGTEYHAKISISDGTEIEASLPKVNENGYLLSLRKIKGTDVVTIKTNQETFQQEPNAQLTLICETRGVTYFESSQLLKETTLSFTLPKTDFPEGISQITLYDANLKPQSERLVYIEKDQNFEATLTTDKKNYKPLEKVKVNISSKTKAGVAVPASFSLSSTDLNGVKNDTDYGTTISSFFLMESDIRGQVHNPSYYFDATNPKRLEHLDLLLLTQGWRDFLWKTMPKENDSIHYNIEKKFSVAGHVKRVFGNKPIANNNVTLTLVKKKGFNAFNTVTNSEGDFVFDDLSFYGETTMFLNSRNEKGKNRGEIIVYKTQKDTLEVDFKKKNVIFNNTTSTLKEKIYKKYVKYGIRPENMLDEVKIIGKKKEKRTPSLYGKADNTYVIDDKTQRFTTIFQLIQFSIPGVMVSGGKIGFSRSGGKPAQILINGAEWAQADVKNIDTDNVAKIESFTGPSTVIFGPRGANGVILIYTKEGSVDKAPKKVFHSVTNIVKGYYDARYFYSPNPEKPNLDFDDKLNVRNTLYWNPYVHPDETGHTQVSYFNTDVGTMVKVTIEGITASGIPVVRKTFYTIEK
jgi:hypothetical protein